MLSGGGRVLPGRSRSRVLPSRDRVLSVRGWGRSRSSGGRLRSWSRWRAWRSFRGLHGHTGKPLRQNVSGAHRGFGNQVRLLFNYLGDDQHFFQMVEPRRRLYPYIQKHLGAGTYRNDVSDGQAFGEDAISAAGYHHFANIDFLIGHDVVHHGLAGRGSLENALQPGFLQQCAHAAGLIVDLQHLRGLRKDPHYLSNDSGRRYDRHIGLEPVARPLVDVDQAGSFAAAGSDHLGGHGVSR